MKINWNNPEEVEKYLLELDEEMKDFDGGRKDVKVVLERKFEGKIKSATIKQNHN